MTESFVSNFVSPVHNAAAVNASGQNNASEQKSAHVNSNTVQEPVSFAPDWQCDETSLVPSFGVDRARELLLWLVNLELRLPPYSEISPA